MRLKTSGLLSHLIAGLAILAGTTIASAAPIDALVGDSEWSGYYRYGNNQSVNFTMRLNVSPNGSFSGSTVEPNTFGDRSASHLYGNIRGSISGSSIQFSKTYNGVGGVNHSVEYQGTLDADGRNMNGNWRTKISGSFAATLTRAPAQRHSSACITAADQLRTTDNFVYWNFRNGCDGERFVSVCAEYANGNNNVLGANVPARGSADINLGHTSMTTAKLTWKEGGDIRCPN